MDDIIQEFATNEGLDPDVVRERWSGNPANIAEDLFQVFDIDSGNPRPLTLYKPSQTKVLNAFFYSDARTLSLYKGRRIGYSFIVCVAFLLDGMINPNSFYPVVGIKEEGAQGRIKDISNLVANAKVDIPLEKDNDGDIILWNGSHFKAYSGAPDSSRGDKSAKAVLLDEKAFYEDQETVSRAYRAFLALGTGRKMVEVSTPNTKNDQFMRTNRDGTPDGSNGTLSIKQPSFHNADDIDPEISLYEQETYLVNPEMDLATVEDERGKDPEGFAQEYLCKPIDDSYAFFDDESIRRAMERNGSIPREGQTVMGVDIGISSDDTVITVFRHHGEYRFQMLHEVVTNGVLQDSGITNPDRGNANHIAHRLGQVRTQYDVDTVVLDRTGPGETFQRIVERKLGRSIRGFNFSAKDKVEDMMGDLNNALRNDHVQLVDDDRLYAELTAIIKTKRKESSKPDFSGKDTSETGKDDTAWAVALGAFPPGMAVQAGNRPSSTQYDEDTEPEAAPGERPTPATKGNGRRPSNGSNFGSVRTTRRRRRDKRYSSKYAR